MTSARSKQLLRRSRASKNSEKNLEPQKIKKSKKGRSKPKSSIVLSESPADNHGASARHAAVPVSEEIARNPTDAIDDDDARLESAEQDDTFWDEIPTASDQHVTATVASGRQSTLEEADEDDMFCDDMRTVSNRRVTSADRAHAKDTAERCESFSGDALKEQEGQIDALFHESGESQERIRFNLASFDIDAVNMKHQEILRARHVTRVCRQIRAPRKGRQMRKEPSTSTSIEEA